MDWLVGWGWPDPLPMPGRLGLGVQRATVECRSQNRKLWWARAAEPWEAQLTHPTAAGSR